MKGSENTMMKLTDRLEDGREYREPQRHCIGYCEWCEGKIYAGDKVLRAGRFYSVEARICLDCYAEMDRQDLAELLGATFEEAECRF